MLLILSCEVVGVIDVKDVRKCLSTSVLPEMAAVVARIVVVEGKATGVVLLYSAHEYSSPQVTLPVLLLVCGDQCI